MKTITRKSILTLMVSLLWFQAFNQSSSFGIWLEPMNITNLGGLQAFAFGQHNGKWLMVGGRLDGLHRRQPWASFDVAGNNNTLIVVDPVLQQVWTSPLSSLSVDLQEQLSSTNMQFHQDNDRLYVIGGYGYHNATASRMTFSFLTAVDIPGAINAIINANTITPYFRQISDSNFAVTGGHLKKINNTYYLLGGNKFDGNYNPMGNPTYTQVYTNAVRKFNIQDDGVTLTINHLTPYTSIIDLHRRDYNAVAQIMNNGSQSITMFSGVFQPTVDLPYLNCVEVDSVNFNVNNSFQQHYNHYHCAVLPLYTESDNEMHNIFFGGIAQFYDSSGVLVQDNNVPFVKTIARVTRNGSGIMTEYKLPIDMPDYLGAGAEFIPIPSIPHYPNEVIKLDSLSADTTMVGYIFGGIQSSNKNIFFGNNGTESEANATIYKVFVLKNNSTGFGQINQQSNGLMQMEVYPNPHSGGPISIKFISRLPSSTATLTISNMQGKILKKETLQNIKPGSNLFSLSNLKPHGPLLIRLTQDQYSISRKLIFSE